MYRTRLSWEEKNENVSGLVLATGSSTSVKVSISYSASVADVNGAPSLVNPETRNFDQNSFYTLKGYYINLSGKIYYIPQDMTVSRTSSGGAYTWKASTAKRIISVGQSVSSGPKEKNVVISSKITASSNNGDNLMLGSVCSSQLEISIRSIESDFSAAKGSSFSVYKIAPDGSETKIGVYNVSDAKWTSEHIYKIIAHDNVSKLNRDITGWLRGLTGWPYALTEFYGMLCDEVGVSHTYSTWDGASSFMVNQFDVEDGTTGQQLMGSICEIMGDYCIAQPDGSLRADWYSRRYIRIHSKANQVSEGSDIDVYRYGGSLTYGDYNVKDVKFVQFREEDSDDAALWPDYGNVNNADLSNAYIITGNPIILTHPTYLTDNSSSNSVRTAFDKIADRFDFETYRPFSVAIPETTNVHVGDYVMVGDENDKVLFLAPITDMTWTGNRISLECTAKVNRENLDDPENWTNTQLAKYSDRVISRTPQEQLFAKLAGSTPGMALNNGQISLNQDFTHNGQTVSVANQYYNGLSDTNESSLNEWADQQLATMADMTVRDVAFRSAAANAHATCYGKLCRHNANYAILYGFNYDGYLVLKVRFNGVWQAAKRQMIGDTI